ncbi:hypothetical protein DPMN_067431 [Dreissena polymorpha]|uniref:Uncharacterized protein n=1 Tax=Dreissena polymorpha TaxID=45954 RepID=A0A9D3YX96_DREPO|nr:hypothetical protein DPMN_067431 [Dreissena polymorpha]
MKPFINYSQQSNMITSAQRSPDTHDSQPEARNLKTRLHFHSAKSLRSPSNFFAL